MEDYDEMTLLKEIERLRQELYQLLSDHSAQLTSPTACALSARLDLLIARYMREQLGPSIAGS